MTYFGITDSVHHTDRLLPLPYLPTYIARRPKKLKLDSDTSILPYHVISTANWQKASDHYAAKHRSFYDSPFINIELESILTSPKEYDTYKQSFHSGDDSSSTDLLNRIRPITVPNYLTKTSEQWSRFLDEYPDRFKIQYPLPDVDNDLYVQKRPGRYPYQTYADSTNFYSGLTNQIHPVTNPFRKVDSKQKSMVTHPIWVPYGTAPRRQHKP